MADLMMVAHILKPVRPPFDQISTGIQCFFRLAVDFFFGNSGDRNADFRDSGT